VSIANWNARHVKGLFLYPAFNYGKKSKKSYLKMKTPDRVFLLERIALYKERFAYD